MASEWNSLEVAQLAVAALMPLTLLGLGLIVAQNTRRLDSYQHANQTVLARRHEIFQEVAPKLNQLLCFMAFVGRWKEITPADVLSLKRDVDEVMYTNRLLFSDELFATYQAFMARFFAMYATIDSDALIRARISFDLGDRRKLHWWSASMVDMFAQDHVCEPGEAQLSYDELSAAFREDLYVTNLTRPLPPIMRKREGDYASSNALVESTADSTRLESFDQLGRAAVGQPRSGCEPTSGRPLRSRSISPLRHPLTARPTWLFART
jgi:hypothetical protein